MNHNHYEYHEEKNQNDGHKHEDHSHDNHDHHHHHGDFKQLFFRSLPLAIIIMIFSPMMGVKLPFQFTFLYSDIIVAILSTILLIYGGRPFYKGAIDEFKDRKPSMMSLVSLGISVSYIYSIYAVVSNYILKNNTMDFFFEFASLILIMLLGHWIEMKAVGEAGDAQRSLAELLPKEAQVVLEDGNIEVKKLSCLKIGDTLRVQAGEKIPADGVITKGSSQVNEALLTGESKPVVRKKGDRVIGGSTNGEGILFVKVKEMGEKSFLSQVQNLVSQAQSQSSRAETLAQKVANWLFYIAVIVSIISFLVWLKFSNLESAILFMITTLVIACPHALGLAIPLVIARSTSLGARRGLLVKNREALELANKANIMILDKTGTLTTGEFKVLQVDSLDENYDKNSIISLLYGIEAGSSHPIAVSISNYAKSLNIKAKEFEEINNIVGVGIETMSKGIVYKLVSRNSYKKDLSIKIPKGATQSILIKDNKVIGAVSLGDELKPSSIGLIKYLKSNNIKPILATGDNEEAGRAVAEILNIDFYANQSPEDKYKLIKKFKNKNKTIIMVGDGINDAPSLALADVGIAIGAGTQVAMDSADVILTKSDPLDISSFIELSNKTTRKIKENLFWGAGYNFVAIPLAAGILAPIGFVLSPAIGAILMSISTVIVAVNALLLKID